MPLSLVILISGRGSNLEAILKAIEAGELRAQVTAVISSSADDPGLAFAQRRTQELPRLLWRRSQVSLKGPPRIGISANQRHRGGSPAPVG